MKSFERFCQRPRPAMAICLIAGILGALPYYFEPLFIFTFISLFLLFFVAVQQKRAVKKVFLPFFCYYIGFFTLLYLFLSELYPYERFGFDKQQAVFVVFCSCILIPLLHAAVESLIMLTSKWFPKGNYDIFGYAALWVIAEWILSLGALAFPWSATAVSLTGFLPYIQTASLFGKYFITFITAFSCAAFAKAISDKRLVLSYVGICVLLVNTLFGVALRYIPCRNDNRESVTAALIQGNVLSNEKWVSSNKEAIFNRYIGMAEEAAKSGARIIVIPESAIPSAFYENSRIHTSLSEIAEKYGVIFIAGVNYKADGISGNSVIAVYPDGTLSERYDKRHLVPFGEFIPFADIIGRFFPFVAEFNNGSSTINEGSKPVIIETEYGSVTPLVCFDSIFPQFAYEGCGIGAEMIAIVTNDSWFNDSVGIYTHLRHAQLRAIENRKPVLRAANTGVSAFIDEKGRITESSQPLEADIVYSPVTFRASKTLYNRIGDIVLYISFAIVFISIINFYIMKFRENNNGKNSAS